ncbi:MAG: hypothetical protein CJBNEKGG_02326 [Prosthecobacter sp.]|nr:hypothetical protein [Prosthecobacter sp.]
MKISKIEPEIVMRRGKPVSVILPVKAYEKLLERLEDAEDAAAMQVARKKPLSFRPISKYMVSNKGV